MDREDRDEPRAELRELDVGVQPQVVAALGLFEELGELENVLDQGGDDFRCEGEKRAAGVAIASETNPFPLLA